MAFPISGTLVVQHGQKIPIPDNVLKQLRRANVLKNMRKSLLNKLFRNGPTLSEEGVERQLGEIAQILGRIAGNEPTIYDNGSYRSSATGVANALSQQVERALTQVLGRTPGKSYDGFINALNSAFPTDGYGKVITTPARSVVSLNGSGNYSNVGNGSYAPASNGNYPGTDSSHPPAPGYGYTSAPVSNIGIGQLSAEQANLYRQGSIIAADALKVLDGLQPFDPIADIDAVEALRALIRSQICTLVDEFGRIDEPRRERVDTYLDTLLTDDLRRGSIIQLGEQARLLDRVLLGNSGEVFPITLYDETQVAGFELLKNYADLLRTIFEQFVEINDVEKNVTGRYSERLSRAYILLPVISDSNTSFMAAMDSVGFTASERRSDAALFSLLGRPQIPTDPESPNATNITLPVFPIPAPEVIFSVLLPDITINDFNEWVERFATLEAPSILSASGQFGLDFVTDQADTLFWVISIVLSLTIASDPDLGLIDQLLSFERVKQTLNELLFQLDTLASLGIGSTAPLLESSASRGGALANVQN
jgi:hypothetical protein